MTKTKPRLDPHDPGPMPEAQTTCIHCGQPFKSTSVPIIGEAPTAKFQRYMQDLAKHIAVQHPEVMNWIGMQGGTYNGLLLMSQFKGLDPELEHQKDMTRHEVYVRMQRVKVTDQMIASKIDQLFTGPRENPEELMSPKEATNILTWLRDQYEERNYAQQPPSTLVLPS